MIIGLFEPQIPQNTGNIARSCAVTGSKLLLFGDLGFSLSDRQMKRAGLDYWDSVCLGHEADMMRFLEDETRPFFFFSSNAEQSYWDVSYTPDSLLIFGAETHGLPSACFEKWPERCVRIPMLAGQRCLNLASSVAVGLYEAIRQVDKGATCEPAQSQSYSSCSS